MSVKSQKVVQKNYFLPQKLSERTDVTAPLADSASAEGKKLPSLEHLQVLVVEDHTDSREFVQKVLEEAGATVTTACCSQDAIALLEHIQPDIIVSDIAMPREDGYQFIRHLRSSGSETPAIALTVYARPEDQRQSLNAGFQMHMPKPISTQGLIRAIAQLVKLPEPSVEC